MKIRKATLQDAREILSILNKAPELQIAEEVETYDQDWINGVLTHPKENLVLIAEDEKKIIGLLIAHYLRSVKQSILNDLHVHKDHPRKGVASQLMRAYEKILKKQRLRIQTALILPQNKEMRTFIEKNHYRRGHLFYFYEKH